MGAAEAAAAIGGGAVSGGGAGAALGPWGALAGAVIGAGAGFAGWWIQDAAEDERQRITKEAQRKYGEVTAQTLAEAAKDVLGPTKLAEIHANPEYRQAQNEALAEYKRIADSGGMTIEQQAGFNDVLARSSQQASQTRRAALQRMQERGLNTSGAETALAAAGEQSGANAANHAGVQMLGEAQRNALSALGSRAQLAGNMGKEDYDRQSDAAKAQDVINQLNWGNRANIRGMQQGAAAQQYGFATGNANAVAGQANNTGRVVAGIGNDLGTAVRGLSAQGAPPTPTPTATPEKRVVPYAPKPGYEGITANWSEPPAPESVVGNSGWKAPKEDFDE